MRRHKETISRLQKRHSLQQFAEIGWPPEVLLPDKKELESALECAGLPLFLRSCWIPGSKAVRICDGQRCMYDTRANLDGGRMNISEAYDYLVRARRDLWAALERVPGEVLSRPLLDGDRFHCIKDLVFHIAATEDFWIREEILRERPIRQTIPALNDTRGGPVFAAFPFETLLDYWRLVEQGTLKYLPALDDHELKRLVTVHDRPGKRYTVDGVFWNVIIHEARHVAQISVLLRTQGIAPPFLDLVKYLPVPSA
jgi:uncharacterized damage-inducible protein DinB